MSVCETQDLFNDAFRKAIKYNNEQNAKEARNWMTVYLILWAIFLIWAVLLAMKVNDAVQRRIHLLFALVAGPAYVLAYYLGGLNNGKGGAAMSMCGARDY